MPVCNAGPPPRKAAPAVKHRAVAKNKAVAKKLNYSNGAAPASKQVPTAPRMSYSDIEAADDFDDDQKAAMKTIKRSMSAAHDRQAVREAMPDPGWKRFITAQHHHVKAKTMIVNGKKVTYYVTGNKSSPTFLCKVCGMPIVVLGIFLSFYALNLYQTTPEIRLAAGCSLTPQFYMPESERPIFGGCTECEEHCMQCKPCYDATTVWYEEDKDRCARAQGQCGFPFGSADHCTQTCGPVMTRGREGLHCVNAAESLDEQLGGFEFCSARDPTLPVLYGVDPFGEKRGRVGPSVHLPRGYGDDPDKKWPVIMAIHGIHTCGNMFYWYTGLRPIAYEKGYIIIFPDAASPLWCTPLFQLANVQGECKSDEWGVADDMAYLKSLVEELKRDYSTGEFFVFGWSNGAAMANTVACYMPDVFTGALMYSNGRGHIWADPTHPTYSKGCTELTDPIHGVYIHDPIDPVVTYSNAVKNLEEMASWNGCSTVSCPEKVGSMDIIPLATGWHSWVPHIIKAFDGAEDEGRIVPNETSVWRFHGEGHTCLPGGSVELWTMDSWGSDTNWYIQGHASLFGDMEIPGVGHFNAFGHANDHGEHHALARRMVEWCDGMMRMNHLDGEPTEADEDWLHGFTGNTDRRRRTAESSPPAAAPAMSTDADREAAEAEERAKAAALAALLESDEYKATVAEATELALKEYEAGKAAAVQMAASAKAGWAAQARSAAAKNRRRAQFMMEVDLTDHAHENCPHWSAQKHQLDHNIKTMICYIAVPLVLLLLCCCADLCLCISWIKQNRTYRKYIAQERKRGWNTVHAAVRMGNTVPRVRGGFRAGGIGAIRVQPRERNLGQMY